MKKVTKVSEEDRHYYNAIDRHYYNAVKDIQNIVDSAGITAEEPTFDDFLNKANDYMAVARDDGYYNAVMLNKQVDEEKIIVGNINEAIRVLELAKQFASKVGF